MRANNVLGIIYSNSYDSVLSELTNLRTMGSVPFGGRYRLIDFPLSNMVNCGITTVGVITKSNYRSLMDHLGTGKAWDLSRKRAGMFILPPFSSTDSGGVFNNKVEALKDNLAFIRRSNEEFVIICDSNVLCNMDFEKLLDAHVKAEADITIAYKRGPVPNLEDLLTFNVDDTGRISNATPTQCSTQATAYSLNIFVFKKALLERLINETVCLNTNDFERDIIRGNIDRMNVHGYEFEGFARTIDSLQSYYDISMELLNSEKRNALFAPERPIYTKLRDDMPVVYGLDSRVSNSLIADGCKIDGEVENCILFRRVTIAKGAKVKDSIIMQDTFVGENTKLDCVITDKNAVIKPGKTLAGAANYPLFVGKGIIV